MVLRDREALARQLEGFLAGEEGRRTGAEGALAPGSEEEAQLVVQLRQMIKEASRTTAASAWTT